MTKLVDLDIVLKNLEIITVYGKYDYERLPSMSMTNYYAIDFDVKPDMSKNIEFNDHTYILRDGGADKKFLLANKGEIVLRYLQNQSILNINQIVEFHTLKAYLNRLHYLSTILKRNLKIAVIEENYENALLEGYHPKLLTKLLKDFCDKFKSELMQGIIDPFIFWITKLVDLLDGIKSLKSAKESIQFFTSIKLSAGHRKTKALSYLKIRESQKGKLIKLFQLLIVNNWIESDTVEANFLSVFESKNAVVRKIVWVQRIFELKLFLRFIDQYSIKDDNNYATAGNLFEIPGVIDLAKSLNNSRPTKKSRRYAILEVDLKKLFYPVE